MPDASLPQSPYYPGGRSRVIAHIEAAKASHQSRFGEVPAGMWPAEGAVSGPLLEVMAQQGCRWAASGEGVLVNSLRDTVNFFPERAQYLYRPYRMRGREGGITCFFRDDRLSDLIGFEYSRWHGKDAALHFVAQLDDIAHQAPAGETPLVSVILDGENAWEYYPYNAFYFFSDLYEMLEAREEITTTTYRAYLDRCAADPQGCARPGELAHLTAGSWVYGNFSTWIGSHDKNRAWDLLCAAKQSYDLIIGSGHLTDDERAAVEKQLASCESSDWFWWFGDYNPAQAVSSFDRLFRHNLVRLYQLLKLPVPVVLNEPISRGGGQPEAGGAMRRAS
jgi:alpha-amylase/alpha-mannosidase (GH57 family)